MNNSLFSDIEVLKRKLNEFIRDEEKAKNEYGPWIKFANDLAKRARTVKFATIGSEIAAISDQERQHKSKFENMLYDIQSIESGLKREYQKESANDVTPTLRQYVQGATRLGPVIYRRRGEQRPSLRGELFRARDGTYFVEVADGQIYASMGWERV